MRITAVTALFADLPEAELTAWVVRGWVQPARPDPDRADPDRADPDRADPDPADADAATWDFLEIDVARVRLIHDLRRSMEIAEETMPLVLSLLDQIYDLRGTLRDVLRALETQPEPVRTSVLAALRRG
jgi:chaperone modulatory protein CbpM